MIAGRPNSACDFLQTDFVGRSDLATPFGPLGDSVLRRTYSDHPLERTGEIVRSRVSET